MRHACSNHTVSASSELARRPGPAWLGQSCHVLSPVVLLMQSDRPEYGSSGKRTEGPVTEDCAGANFDVQ